MTFDPTSRSVVIEVHVTGPRRTLKTALVIDTGASTTVIRATLLASLGLIPGPDSQRRRLRSATGGRSAPVVVARQLLALWLARADFPVAAHDLPPGLMVDGLLGLDFLRVLTLDFARGRVGLRGLRRWWPWD